MDYLYDGAALVVEMNSSGTILRRYVPGAGTDETLVWYEGSNLSTPAWLHTDQQGSIVAASNSSGVSASIHVYGPFGEGGIGGSGPIFRYTGQAQLAAIGLYYYKARVYDPVMGRFLQTDPIGYSAGTNLYAYVSNNPSNATDPSGMEPPSDQCENKPASLIDGCPETITVTGYGPECSAGGRAMTPSFTVPCLSISEIGLMGGYYAVNGVATNVPIPIVIDARVAAPKPSKCPSAGSLAVYQMGGVTGNLGGRALAYGAALEVGAAAAASNPVTAAAAPPAALAGGVALASGAYLSTMGAGFQIGAGAMIWAETGNWGPLFATGAPVVAGFVGAVTPIAGPFLEDSLQSYFEANSPKAASCK